MREEEPSRDATGERASCRDATMAGGRFEAASDARDKLRRAATLAFRPCRPRGSGHASVSGRRADAGGLGEQRAIAVSSAAAVARGVSSSMCATPSEAAARRCAVPSTTIWAALKRAPIVFGSSWLSVDAWSRSTMTVDGSVAATARPAARSRSATPWRNSACSEMTATRRRRRVSACRAPVRRVRYFVAGAGALALE
jgi:hypothetical protein